jgi:hypothetical protein
MHRLVSCVLLAACAPDPRPPITESPDAAADGPGEVSAAIRLLAPLSGTVTTSRRPTLRWQLPAVGGELVVEICATRDCSTVEHTLDASAVDTAVPPAELAPGAHYWRVRAVGVEAFWASPVWEFFVGQRSAPTDTSWGTSTDVDGDGLGELVVGARISGDGAAYVYAPTTAGVPATPSLTFKGPPGGKESTGVGLGAGDFNGDGFIDLVVGACTHGDDTGRVHIFHGGAAGIASTPTTTLVGPDGPGSFFGYAVGTAGDVDGDGFPDLAIAGFRADGEKGKVYLYRGGATGIAETATPMAVLAGTDPGGRFGRAMVSAGDVNHDGFADLLIAASNANADTGAAYLFYGAADGIAGGASPDLTFTAPDGAGGLFGSAVTAADYNGDRLADVAITARAVGNGTGRAHVYLGTAAGLPTTPAATLTGPDVDGYFGNAATSADVDGDGLADLIVAAFNTAPLQGGRVHVYAGTGITTTTNPSASLDGLDPYGFFGFSLAAAGDLDGDGYADLAMGAYWSTAHLDNPPPNLPPVPPTPGPGTVHLFRGGPTGVPSPLATLIGPAGDAGYFGYSVW